MIEALLYVALMSLLTIMVINTALAMNTTSAKARLKRNILGEVGIATERMIREIRLANSVLVAESALAVNPGILKINTTIDENNSTPITKEFYLADGKLMMKEGGNQAIALTERVAVTRLIFYHTVSGTVSEAVVLEVTAEDTIKNLTEIKTFNTSTVLRRSY